MTLDTIYRELTPGSWGFVKAVAAHCGFDISDDEIRRIAMRAESANQFMSIWDKEDWWTDANN